MLVAGAMCVTPWKISSGRPSELRLSWGSMDSVVPRERSPSRAFRNYRGLIKEREEGFSLGENHERCCGFGLHQLRNRYRQDERQATRWVSLDLPQICSQSYWRGNGSYSPPHPASVNSAVNRGGPTIAQRC